MSSHTLNQDRQQILDELEKYYSSKLKAVQAKREGHGKGVGLREVVADEGVRIRINSKQREVTLSWIQK